MKITFLFLLAIALAACNDTATKDPEKTALASGKITSLPNELLKIDTLNKNKWTEGGTLNYSKLDGLVGESVSLFINEKSEVEKYTQKFSMPGKGGVRHFYAQKNKIYAIMELFEESSNPNKSYMVERYSKVENDKVVETIERIADFEDDLINKPFNKTEVKQVDIAYMKRIINQEGEFETTFQGFLENGASVYMLVGEPKPGKDAFTAALQVDPRDPFIQGIMADPPANMNRKMSVEFEDVRDANSGFTVQFMLNGKFL
jgi:hypothetical protein